MSNNTQREDAQRFFEVVNDSGVDVPPFAVMAVTGRDADGTPKVGYPTKRGQIDVYVNANATMLRGGRGMVQSSFPSTVLYSPSPTEAAIGDQLGVVANSFSLSKFSTGFVANEAGFGNLVSVMRATTNTVKVVRVGTRIDVDEFVYNAVEYELDDSVIPMALVAGEACFVYDLGESTEALTADEYRHGLLHGSLDGKRVWSIEPPGSDTPDPPDPPVGECAGCGWLLDWPVTTAANCLRLTIIGASGKCQCINAGQEIDLFYDSGGNRWLGGTFATCCGCSVVEFTRVVDTDRPEVYGKLRLVKRNVQCDTSDQTEYKLSNSRCCAPGTIDFDGANTNPAEDNCDGSLDECSNYFVGRLQCVACPPGLCCCRGCYVGVDPTCLEIVEAPPAFYLDLSSAGFTGAGIVWNIPWVLITESTGNESCIWGAECLDPVVTITLAWIDDTGWRLTLSTTGGTAVYETSNPAGEECCEDIVLDKISSSFGGPATITLTPIGCAEAGSCSDAPDGRTFSVILDANENCPCLDGVMGTLTYSGGVFTGTVGADPCSCTDHGSPLGNLVFEMPTDCSGFDIFCGECVLGLLFVEIVERCPLTITFGLMFTEHVGNCCAAGGAGTSKIVTATVVEN